MINYLATTGNGNIANCQFIGRWVPKTIQGQAVMYTTNLGAEVVFSVTGTQRVQLEMLDLSHADSPAAMIAVSINQGAYQRFSVAKMPVVLAGLEPSQHYQIRVVMSGNSDIDAVWLGQEGFAFKGAEIDAAGQMTAIEPAGRRITFIGDSITAGCWVAGRSASEDYRGEANYAAIAADLLGAADIRIAYSAAGLTRGGTGGVPTAFDYLENLDAETSYPVIQTDPVVINLDTNDGAVSVTTFETKMTQFLNQAQTAYPSSHIVLVIPFNQQFAASFPKIIAKFQGIQLIETADWNLTYTDQAHPDLAGSRNAGQKLATALQDLLGPNYFSRKRLDE